MASEMTAAAAVKPATRAYVTILAGDGDCWNGVVGLAIGLRKVGSAYPLVVAVLPDVPESRRRILVSEGCIVREIEPVYPPENQTQFAMDYYAVNYSMLRIWEFVEYERMVYLDAGIQVVDNIDELFELETGSFYAAMDKVLPWPAAELASPPSLNFDACMFVHEPSMATAKALLDTLRVTPPTSFAVQDLLNMFFSEQYKPIPPMYVQPEKVKVLDSCATGYAGKEANIDREDIEGLPADADEVKKKKFAPFRSCLAAEAKDAIFAPNNLPALATLAASSAAAGVVATAASPTICFSFYALFIAAMVVVTISLRTI